MRVFALLVLSILLFLSLFKIGGADLNNNVLAIALMVLLLSLFSDLKEFNFWGLMGKKPDPDLKKLEGKKAITSKKKGQVTKKDLAEAEKSMKIPYMAPDTSNFLALAFEIERLLRVYGNVNLVKDIPSNINPMELMKELRVKGYLSESGVKQFEVIRWLRNMLVHGRENEINYETLRGGTQLAWDFYQELYNWLYPSKKAK